jgi:hypothetical protein
MNTHLSSFRDEWVRDYLKPRYPDLVPSFLEAQAIHARAMAQGFLGPDDAERLLAHALSKRTPLGENVASMIGELYAKVPELETVIRALAAGKQVHERINALVALDSGPPSELHTELLSHLLLDKSGRVRALACDKIVLHRLVALASRLESVAAQETNRDVADELHASVDYLRKGFHVRQMNGNFWVTCLSPRGGGRVSKLFRTEEYKNEAKAWIADVLSGTPA